MHQSQARRNPGKGKRTTKVTMMITKRHKKHSWACSLVACRMGKILGRRHSPPRRGGVDAPTASGLAAQTGWSDRRNVSDELTTPARQPCGCRASPPLRGRECIRSKLVHSIYLCGGGTTDWSCLC